MEEHIMTANFEVMTLSEMLEDVPGVLNVKQDLEDDTKATVEMKDTTVSKGYLTLMLKASDVDIEHNEEGGTIRMSGRQDRILRHVSPKMVSH